VVDAVTATAVILAGGKGTRSADPTKAKLGQELDGIPLLQWHMRLLAPSEITRAVVVAGHLGKQVDALTKQVVPLGMDLSVIHEAEQRGTVAALSLAAHETQGDEFLVILGDILMSLPIQQFLDEWRASNNSVAVVVHPSTHPEDSDAAFPTHDGRVLVVPKSQPRDHIPNMSSAGLFAISRAGLQQYADLKDFGSNVLPAAAEAGDLFAFVSSHYLKDTGTPARLEAAQGDIERGSFARRGDLGPRAALFLDRDGVINPSHPEFHRAEGYELLPGVPEAIAEANRAGIPTIVITNQPAIAKGFMTFDEHQRIRAAMDRLLGSRGAFVDDYLFCPHHPETGFDGEIPELKTVCDCRKPSPGLLREAAQRHALDLTRSAMVGDTDRDHGAAQAVGTHFVHVCDDCSVPDREDCFEASADAIRRGIEVVTC
jgi:histidinol-phosphate phosphatase family protein